MRKLPAAAQEKRRRQVIELRQAGLTYGAIAAQIGLTQTGVFDICTRYARRGEAGLKTGQRGPDPGYGRLLTAEQEAETPDLIRRNIPDALDLPFALWSRAAVRRWLQRGYPAIAARAKVEGDAVFWGDETGLRVNARRAPGGCWPTTSQDATAGLAEGGSLIRRGFATPGKPLHNASHRFELNAASPEQRESSSVAPIACTSAQCACEGDGPLCILARSLRGSRRCPSAAPAPRIAAPAMRLPSRVGAPYSPCRCWQPR